MARADDHVAGHRQIGHPAVDLRDADVNVIATTILATVEHFVIGDRGGDVALGRPLNAVPGSRSLVAAEILDVVVGDSRPVEPAGVESVLADAIQVIAGNRPAGGVFEVNGIPRGCF